MAKKTEISVEEKLRALFDLQLIDSRIDQIRSIRGELPLEVEDLENEITALNKRLEGHQEEIKASKEGIKFEENSISTAKESHKKYVGDLKKVRNNREYNAIVKEQEFQELEACVFSVLFVQMKLICCRRSFCRKRISCFPLSSWQPELWSFWKRYILRENQEWVV